MNNKKAEEKKQNRILLIAIYLLFVFLMLFVSIITIFKPQENLIVKHTIVFSVGSLVLSIFIYWLWDKISKDNFFINIFKGVLLLSFIGLLVYVSLLNADRQGILTDYNSVLQSAKELADGKAISNFAYFERYSNNIKPALFLSVIFKVGRKFSIPDFASGLGVSVIQVLLTVISTAILLKDEKKSFGIPAILLFALCLPIYVFTGVFYTDTMSFGLAFIALALIKLGIKYDGLRKILLCVAAGCIAAYGISWKITVIIPFIALVISLVASKKKMDVKAVLAVVISFIACVILINIWAGSYDITKQAKGKGHPVISWVALGLKEDGSWAANRDYIDVVDAMESTKDKKEYTYSYLKENYKEAFNPDHLAKKAQYNFAGGMLRSQIYLGSYDSGTLLWATMNPWGKYHWRTSQFTFCYIISVYLLFLLGAIFTIANIFRGKRIPEVKMLADISMLGIIVFLMIWEANSRQLYNQVPIMIIGSIANGRYIVNCIKGLKIFKKKD